MHRKRNRRKERGARLEMTPMIDVVFLLLVFFVVRGEMVLRGLACQAVVSPQKASEGWSRLASSIRTWFMNHYATR
jgi:biopolymer transport protein ExbD